MIRRIGAVLAALTIFGIGPAAFIVLIWIPGCSVPPPACHLVYEVSGGSVHPHCATTTTWETP